MCDLVDHLGVSPATWANFTHSYTAVVSTGDGVATAEEETEFCVTVASLPGLYRVSLLCFWCM